MIAITLKGRTYPREYNGPQWAFNCLSKYIMVENKETGDVVCYPYESIEYFCIVPSKEEEA